MMLTSKDLNSIRDMAIYELRNVPNNRTLPDLLAPMNESQSVTYSYVKSVIVYLRGMGVDVEFLELKELL
jgi:hypothetical protein